MDDSDDFNLIRILKAEIDVALPALKEVFETQWNKKYPDTKWTNDRASVTLFDQREEEVFQKNLNRLSKGEKGKRISKKKQTICIFKDEEWKTCNWDISKFVYALIEAKLFQLDETDDDGIPISEHIAEIRNMRNRSAHKTDSRCSKTDLENVLASLSKHIKAFEILDIDVHRYVEKLERISSEEAPMSQQERYILQLELKCAKEISEQREKTHEERKKRCELQDRVIAMQSKHAEEVECLKAKVDRITRELLIKCHELEMVKLAHQVEIQRLLSDNDNKRHKDETEKRHSLKFQNIQLTESEISSVVLRRSKRKSSSQRNTRSSEQLVLSDISNTQIKNKSKRNAVYFG